MADFFQRNESAPSGESLPLAEAMASLKFNSDGLIPVVAQEVGGGVLMLAWANRESLALTLKTGEMVYYSRSRKRLWRKGETSGNIQRLVELRMDCDGDSLLAVVKQSGPACHTGRRSCFFYAMRKDSAVVLAD